VIIPNEIVVLRQCFNQLPAPLALVSERHDSSWGKKRQHPRLRESCARGGNRFLQTSAGVLEPFRVELKTEKTRGGRQAIKDLVLETLKTTETVIESFQLRGQKTKDKRCESAHTRGFAASVQQHFWRGWEETYSILYAEVRTFSCSSGYSV